jgi:hypothetical protein
MLIGRSPLRHVNNNPKIKRTGGQVQSLWKEFFSNKMTRFLLIRYIDAEKFILKKQKGLCRCCKQKFNKTETLVSAGQVNKKYYHKECAERLNII